MTTSTAVGLRKSSYRQKWRKGLADPKSFPAFGQRVKTDHEVLQWLEGIIWSGGILTPFEKRMYRELSAKLGRPEIAT